MEHSVLLELIFDSESQETAVVLHTLDDTGTPVRRHGSPVPRSAGVPLPVGSPIELLALEGDSRPGSPRGSVQQLASPQEQCPPQVGAEEQPAEGQHVAAWPPQEEKHLPPFREEQRPATAMQHQHEPPSPGQRFSEGQHPPLPAEEPSEAALQQQQQQQQPSPEQQIGEQLHRDQPAVEQPVPAQPPQQPQRPPSGPLGESGFEPELLLSVARLLQQLADKGTLAAEQATGAAGSSAGQQAAGQDQGQRPPPPGPRDWVDVQKLLGLELEVVRLQQALKILEVEFQSRAEQAKSLEHRLQEARAEAAGAEGRAVQLSNLVQQLKSQCLQLEAGRAAAQQQLLASQARERELEVGKAQAERALQTAERALQAAQQQTGDWRQRLMQLKQENQQLKGQISAAAGNLRTLGIPASKVFSRSAVAHAQLASPPNSPADLLPPGMNDSGLSTARPSTDMSTAGQLESGPSTARPNGAAAAARPAVVPRLQLAALAAQPGPWSSSGTPTSSQDVDSPSADTPSADSVNPASVTMQQQLPPAVLAAAAPSGAALEQQGPQLPPLIDLASARNSPARVEQPGMAASVVWASAFPDPGSPPLGGPSPVIAPGGGKLKGHGWGSGGLAAAQAGVHAAEQQASPLLHSNRAGERAKALQAVEVAAAGSPPLAKSGAGAERQSGDADSSSLIGAWRPPSQSHLQIHAQQQSQLGQLQHSHDGKLLRASFAASSTAVPVTKPKQPATARGLPQTARGTPLTARGTPLTARGPQLHTARGAPPSSARGQLAQQQQRVTYSQMAEFLEVMDAYNTVMASEEDKASRWARSMLSNRSAVDSDPAKVEPMVQGLMQLFEESGVHLPLRHTGPCQYSLGHHKMVVRLVNGRLMARSGSSNVCVFSWLGKLPVVQPEL